MMGYEGTGGGVKKDNDRPKDIEVMTGNKEKEAWLRERQNWPYIAHT